MSLSVDLISQFAKATKEDKKTKSESTVYGTTVEYDGKMYVRLDGSELLTPVTTTTNMEPGERVTVLIKNHSATVTGNITSPSATSGDVSRLDKALGELNDKVSVFDSIVAGSVTTEQLDAEKARIDQLKAEDVIIKGSLTAAEANIKTLQSDNVVVKDTLLAVEANIETLEAEDVDIKNTLTAANGEIENLKVTKLDADIANAKFATIESLSATNATVHNLEGTYADFVVTTTDKFTAIDGDISKLHSDKLDAITANITYAKIADLNATNANVTNLSADIADIDTLIFGSATGSTIQTSFSNAVIAQLGDAQIKSAMIESIAAGKITSGDIITNNVRVKSEDGSLIISDETMQISDNNRVRVQIGKDSSGDYSINIWDVNGNLMFSKGGITDSAIKDAIIRNDMVSDTANIAAHKLDIDSLFEEINGSTNTIKSTQIYVDDQKQTLDVAFKAITEDVGELQNGVSSQGTAISVMQGQIESKIWQQDITSATSGLTETTDTLSTQYEEMQQEIDGLSSTVASHTSEINKKADNSTVTSVTNKVTELEADLDGISATVSNHTSQISQKADNSTVTSVNNKVTSLQADLDNVSATVSNHTSQISNKADNTTVTTINNKVAALETGLSGFQSTVSTTYATKTELSDLEIGGRNLLRNTKNPTDTSYWQAGYVRHDDDLGENVFYITRSATSEVTLGTHRVRVTPGEKYTISAYIKRTDNVSSVDFFFLSRPEGSTDDFTYIQNQIGLKTAPDVWTRCVWTFTMSDNAYEGYFRIDHNGSSDGKDSTLCYTMIKMEKGDKATDWTPAPEDMATVEDLDILSNRVSVTETSITQNEAEIALKASKTEVTEAVNNIFIGGRNLVRDSKMDKDTDLWNMDYNHHTISYDKGYLEVSRVYDANYTNRTFNTQYSSTNPLLLPDEISGKTYTLSVELKAIDGVALNNGSTVFWRVYYDDSDKYEEITIGIPTDLSSTEWRRCYASRTFSIRNWTSSQVSIALQNGDNGICVRNIMLERASKPSSWTPAPEDMATAEEVNDIQSRLISAETNITQNANDIELRATKTEVANAINNMEIGGRNLIVNSSKYRKDSPYSNTSSAADGTKTEGNMYMPCEPGETYTFQCCTDGIWGNHKTDGTGTGWTHIYLYLMTDTDTVGQYTSAVALQDDPSKGYTGRRTWTYTVPNNGTAYTKIMFRFDIHSNGTKSYTVKWWDLKAERGTKATDWTPPPEDMATNTDLTDVKNRITSAETKINQNANSITAAASRISATESAISEVELTADGLTTRLSTAETNIAAAKKQLYHSASGTSGTAGYVGISTIKINNSYTNRPILFEFTNRGQQSSNVSVCFNNTNNTDPSLSHLQHDGGMSFWLYKSSTSTWQLIVKKSEGYDTIYVKDFSNNNSGITVSWTNVHYTELPTANITASTMLAGKLTKATVDNAAKTATNYLNFSSSGLVVGDMTASTLGKNVLIDSDSVDIRNGSTVMASFGADTIELGKHSRASVIDLCNGTGTVRADTYDPVTNSTYGSEGLFLESEDRIVLDSRIVRLNCDNKGESTSGYNQAYMSNYVTAESAYINMEAVDQNTVDGSTNFGRFEARSHDLINVTGMTAAENQPYSMMEARNKSYLNRFYMYPTFSKLTQKLITTGDITTNKQILIGASALGEGGRALGVNKTLWSGGYYMTAGHTATLSEAVNVQPNGIVVVFSEYRDGAAVNNTWHSYFVPKQMVSLHGGAGHCFQLSTSNLAYYGTKYLYISNTKITGHDNNSLTGSTDCGITKTCNRFVMRYVIGV